MRFAEQLTQVFQEVFHDDTITITPQTTADDVEDWDSFSHVNLILAIELAFGIEFEQKEILAFENVGELIHAIENKLRS